MKPTPERDDAYVICSRAVAYVDALQLLLSVALPTPAATHAKAAAKALAQCREVLNPASHTTNKDQK